MRNEIIPYNSNLKELALKLRKQMTVSEILLWNELKTKKMLGYDFDRQRPILSYIVDFYCKKLKLVVEVDGASHDSESALLYDGIRTEEMERYGVVVLRFSNEEVLKSINNVLRTIEDWIKNKEAELIVSS